MVTRGLDALHLSGEMDRSRLYDVQTLAVMKRVLREDSCCVDVGCHQGSILREMLRYAPRTTTARGPKRSTTCWPASAACGCS